MNPCTYHVLPVCLSLPFNSSWRCINYLFTCYRCERGKGVHAPHVCILCYAIEHFGG